MSARLDAGCPGEGADIEDEPAPEGIAAGGTSLLQLLGSSAVLAGACLPVPGPALAGLVLASDAPALARAAASLYRRRFDGNVLEASALLLLVARGNYMASAL